MSFLGWFQQAPRPGFTKATVSAWRVSLKDRSLGSSWIIVRMSAIRKLAAEAGQPQGHNHHPARWGWLQASIPYKVIGRQTTCQVETTSSVRVINVGER